MSKSKIQQAADDADRTAAAKALRKILPPGSRVRGIVVHVSSSGMSRNIRFFVPGRDREGTPTVDEITHLMCMLAGNRRATGGRVTAV